MWAVCTVQREDTKQGCLKSVLQFVYNVASLKPVCKVQFMVSVYYVQLLEDTFNAGPMYGSWTLCSLPFHYYLSVKLVRYSLSLVIVNTQLVYSVCVR